MKFKKEFKRKVLKFLYSLRISHLNLYYIHFYIRPITLQKFNDSTGKIEKFDSKDWFSFSRRYTWQYYDLADKIKEFKKIRIAKACKKNNHKGNIQRLNHNFGTACVEMDYCSVCKLVINRKQSLNTIYNFLPIEQCDTDYYNQFGVLSNKIKLTHLNV